MPFSPESALSIVDETSQNKETFLPHVLKPDEYLWYYRKVEGDTRPSKNARLLLHFGAVDQICDVYINSHAAAHHEGGYLPFTIDVTSFLKKESENDSSDNETKAFFDITVCVKDVTDTSWLSRGKQTLRRGGMFYSAQSGIWQSVWMEWVPEAYVTSLFMVPDIDNDRLSIEMKVSEMKGQVRINSSNPDLIKDFNVEKINDDKINVVVETRREYFVLL